MGNLMVVPLQHLQHGGCDDPGLAAIEQHGLDNGFIKEAGEAGAYACPEQGSGDECPFLVRLLEVLVEGGPVTVVVGDEATEVAERRDSFQGGPVDGDINGECVLGHIESLTAQSRLGGMVTFGRVGVASAEGFV